MSQGPGCSVANHVARQAPSNSRVGPLPLVTRRAVRRTAVPRHAAQPMNCRRARNRPCSLLRQRTRTSTGTAVHKRHSAVHKNTHTSATPGLQASHINSVAPLSVIKFADDINSARRGRGWERLRCAATWLCCNTNVTLECTKCAAQPLTLLYNPYSGGPPCPSGAHTTAHVHRYTRCTQANTLIRHQCKIFMASGCVPCCGMRRQRRSKRRGQGAIGVTMAAAIANGSINNSPAARRHCCSTCPIWRLWCTPLERMSRGKGVGCCRCCCGRPGMQLPRRLCCTRCVRSCGRVSPAGCKSRAAVQCRVCLPPTMRCLSRTWHAQNSLYGTAGERCWHAAEGSTAAAGPRGAPSSWCWCWRPCVGATPGDAARASAAGTLDKPNTSSRGCHSTRPAARRWARHARPVARFRPCASDREVEGAAAGQGAKHTHRPTRRTACMVSPDALRGGVGHCHVAVWHAVGGLHRHWTCGWARAGRGTGEACREERQPQRQGTRGGGGQRGRATAIKGDAWIMPERTDGNAAAPRGRPISQPQCRCCCHPSALPAAPPPPRTATHQSAAIHYGRNTPSQ